MYRRSFFVTLALLFGGAGPTRGDFLITIGDAVVPPAGAGFVDG